MDVQASYEARRERQPKEAAETAAFAVFKLAALGEVLSITGRPWPCCPQYFATLTPAALRREADRLIGLQRAATRFNLPLSPDELTEREWVHIELADRTQDALEAKRIRDRAPKPKGKRGGTS